jgi:hypothetical protein
MSKIKSNFDAILASTPLNTTAAKVTARGNHYDPEIPQQVRKYSDAPVHSDAPYRCVPIPRGATTFTDLTGRKFGRFTVVGYLGKLNPKNQKKSSWLVRCLCGNYETRHAPAIKIANPDACCLKCMAWQAAKKAYAKKGGRPIHDFFEPPQSQ